jgi:hypothetical protein
MGKNTEFNRAAGPIYWGAITAAESLALLLPVSPPKPALPPWPLSLRALTWCMAMLAAAGPDAPPEADASRAALRGNIEAWQALLRDRGRMPPGMVCVVKDFHEAVPTGRDAETLEGHMDVALAAAALTPSQAAHWRIRLGLPDPVATARETGGLAK